MKPRIAVLATGGTIAGSSAASTDAAAYDAATVPIDRLTSAIPELGVRAHLVCEQVSQIDSKNMTLAIWAWLRQRVQAFLDDPQVSGVVVTHGTDTLEETAYWLHLTTSSDKPVVLTGAMRPSNALSADGPANLYDAVCVAACPSSRSRGALVVLAGRVHAARDAAKTSTDAVTAFASGEVGVLGRVGAGQVAWARSFGSAQLLPSLAMPLHGVAKALSLDDLPRVDILLCYADVQGDIVEALVAAGARGIVVAGWGNGSINAALLSALASVAARGTLVVRASRVGAANVIRNATERDNAHRFVAAGGLSPWKARILLMLGLAMGYRVPEELQALFDSA